jgi:MoxR-like ATPase
MQELNQAEDIKQLTEKVKEQNVYFSLLKKEINRAIIGQEYMVDRLLIGLLGNGHVLLEGVPGLAKTLAIKTLCQKRFTERFLEFSLRQICCLQM